MGLKSARRAIGMGAKAVGIFAGRGAGRGLEAASVIVNSTDAPIGTQTSQGSQYAAW